MWRGVFSSIAKTALRVHVLVQWYYIIDQQSAHTPTDNYTSICPNLTAYTTLLKSLHIPF